MSKIKDRWNHGAKGCAERRIRAAANLEQSYKEYAADLVQLVNVNHSRSDTQRALLSAPSSPPVTVHNTAEQNDSTGEVPTSTIPLEYSNTLELTVSPDTMARTITHAPAPAPAPAPC